MVKLPAQVTLDTIRNAKQNHDPELISVGDQLAELSLISGTSLSDASSNVKFEKKPRKRLRTIGDSLSLKTRINSLEAELETRNSRIEELQLECRLYLLQLNAKDESNRKLIAEKDQLSKTLDDLKEKRSEAVSLSIKLRQEIDSLSKRLADLEEQAEGHDGKVGEHVEKITALASDNGALKVEIEELKGIVANAKETLRQEKSRLEQASNFTDSVFLSLLKNIVLSIKEEYRQKIDGQDLSQVKAWLVFLGKQKSGFTQFQKEILEKVEQYGLDINLLSKERFSNFINENEKEMLAFWTEKLKERKESLEKELSEKYDADEKLLVESGVGDDRDDRGRKAGEQQMDTELAVYLEDLDTGTVRKTYPLDATFPDTAFADLTIKQKYFQGGENYIDDEEPVKEPKGTKDEHDNRGLVSFLDVEKKKRLESRRQERNRVMKEKVKKFEAHLKSNYLKLGQDYWEIFSKELKKDKNAEVSNAQIMRLLKNDKLIFATLFEGSQEEIFKTEEVVYSVAFLGNQYINKTNLVNDLVNKVRKSTQTRAIRECLSSKRSADAISFIKEVEYYLEIENDRDRVWLNDMICDYLYKGTDINNKEMSEYGVVAILERYRADFSASLLIIQNSTETITAETEITKLFSSLPVYSLDSSNSYRPVIMLQDYYVDESKKRIFEYLPEELVVKLKQMKLNELGRKLDEDDLHVAQLNIGGSGVFNYSPQPTIGNLSVYEEVLREIENMEATEAEAKKNITPSSVIEDPLVQGGKVYDFFEVDDQTGFVGKCAAAHSAGNYNLFFYFFKKMVEKLLEGKIRKVNYEGKVYDLYKDADIRFICDDLYFNDEDGVADNE